MDSNEEFVEKIEKVAKKLNKFKKEAYFFLFAALDHTVNTVGEKRHVTGEELSKGISQYGLMQYGPMTKSVFEHWGITRTEDFGEMVFALVDAQLMGKTQEDSIEDFKDVYDFDEELDWKKRKKEFSG